MGALLLLLACWTSDAERGRAALERGDLVEAEAAWREALDDDPGSAEALYGLGWTWHLAGQRDAARGAFNRLVEQHPDSPLGYKGQGSLALAEGNLALARERFAAALERAPGDPAIRQSQGLVELAAGDPAQALVTFEALLAEDPTRTEVATGKAEALLQLGRDEEAVAAARAAVEVGGTSRAGAGARITLARALLAATRARVRVDDCAGTAVPVYRWLEEADRVLDEAEATGVRPPDLLDTRRAIRRRRAAVDDQCPGVRAGDGKEFPADG